MKIKSVLKKNSFVRSFVPRLIKKNYKFRCHNDNIRADFRFLLSEIRIRNLWICSITGKSKKRIVLNTVIIYSTIMLIFLEWMLTWKFRP